MLSSKNQAIASNNYTYDLAQATDWATSEISPNHTFLYSIYDFETGEMHSYNGDKQTFPASMSKALNLLVFMEEAQQGKRSLKEKYTLQTSDKYKAYSC